MLSVVNLLERRLLEAESDRVGVLLDLAERHYDRNNLVASVSLAMDVVAACADDPARRADALCAAARAFLAAEAYDLADEVAGRAIADAVTSRDPARESRAREIRGRVLMRRCQYRLARDEFRAAGLRHRRLRDTLAVKRAALAIGDTYRQEGIAADIHRHAERAHSFFKQALRAYRAALAAGEHPEADAAIATASADCECRMGNLGLAQMQVERALALLPRVVDAAIVAEIHMAESRLHRLTGDLRAAEWAGERACSAAKALRDDTLARALHVLAAVHDAQARFERANDIETRGRELLLERRDATASLRAELVALWRRAPRGEAPAASNAA